MKDFTALIILDGFGYSQKHEGNAIYIDGVKNFTKLYNEYPHMLIQASERYVGLPKGLMGNSEVGHTNIGAGRVVMQDITRIDVSIEDGTFFTNKALLKAIENCKEHNSALHLMGLCSDGGVHSHIDHIKSLFELAKRNGIEKVYIHCFTDGRDTSYDKSPVYIEMIENIIKEVGVGKIATVSGRYYAMDRDKNYDRVKLAYDAMVLRKGEHYKTAKEAIEASFANGVYDEFIVPAVIDGAEAIKENDSIIYFNFRPDRAKAMTSAFVFEDFDGFVRENGYFKVEFTTMSTYGSEFTGHVNVAFEPVDINNTIGEYLSSLGKKQLRIAETEKFAHVTYFMNAGVDKANPGEDWVVIKSWKGGTFDKKPEMMAYEVTEEAIKRISSGEYDIMMLNFANPDMVGHTGNLDAAVKAVHTVDECLKKVVDAILAIGGNVIITADHGNCETMIDDEGKPQTAHTTNPVPLVVVGEKFKNRSLEENGALCDIAPTLLYMMNIEKPAEMTGKCLIKNA